MVSEFSTLGGHYHLNVSMDQTIGNFDQTIPQGAAAEIGNKVGKAIKIDQTTLLVMRGRFPEYVFK